MIRVGDMVLYQHSGEMRPALAIRVREDANVANVIAFMDGSDPASWRFDDVPIVQYPPKEGECSPRPDV